MQPAVRMLQPGCINSLRISSAYEGKSLLKLRTDGTSCKRGLFVIKI